MFFTRVTASRIIAGTNQPWLGDRMAAWDQAMVPGYRSVLVEASVAERRRTRACWCVHRVKDHFSGGN